MTKETKELTVAEVMSTYVATVEQTTTVQDAVALMAGKNYGALVVTSQGKPVGMFSERDLVKRVVAEGLAPATTQLSSAMTPKIIAAHPADEFKEVARTMYLSNIRHLPVLDQGRLVGIVSIRDVLRILGAF